MARDKGPKTSLILVPYNGRVWLHFPCATKCAQAGRDLLTAMPADTESLNFSPEEAREMAIGLYRMADKAEAGESIDLEKIDDLYKRKW